MRFENANEAQLRAAHKMANQIQAGASFLDVYSARYENGLLVVEPINANSYAVNLAQHSIYHANHHKEGSGTDRMRQRLLFDVEVKNIQEAMAKQPYYLNAEDALDRLGEVEKLLSKDLSVSVALCKISKSPEGDYCVSSGDNFQPAPLTSLEDALDRINLHTLGHLADQHKTSSTPSAKPRA